MIESQAQGTTALALDQPGNKRVIVAVLLDACHSRRRRLQLLKLSLILLYNSVIVVPMVCVQERGCFGSLYCRQRWWWFGGLVLVVVAFLALLEFAS